MDRLLTEISEGRAALKAVSLKAELADRVGLDTTSVIKGYLKAHPVLRKKFRWKPNSNMPAHYQNIANEDYRKAVVGGDENLLKCSVCGCKNPISLEFCKNCHRLLRVEEAIEKAESIRSGRESKRLILDFFRTLIENSEQPEELLRKMVKNDEKMRKKLAELVD